MSEFAPHDVTAITVAHNSAAVIDNMLASLPAAIRVIVVDNGSTDGTADVVHKARPSARVITNANTGYGNGINRGLTEVETSFALIIGPDVKLIDDALDKLLDASDVFPNAALIAPLIVNPDGSIELSHDAELEKRRALGSRRNEPPPEGPVSAAFLSGAVWLARTRALRAVHGFEPALFLYYEDDDICRRLRNTGFDLILAPDARALHIGGGSVPTTTTYSWIKYWHMGWSRLFYADRHEGGAWGEYLQTGPKLALKAGLYMLVGRRAKARRDWARVSGMTAWILSRPSHAP